MKRRPRLIRAIALILGLLAAAVVVNDGNQTPKPSKPPAPPIAATPPPRPGSAPPARPPSQNAPAAPTAVATADAGDLEDRHHTRLAPAPRRPLRDLLPIDLADTRIEPSPPGGRRDVLRITPGLGGRRAARAIYKRARAATADPTRYRIRWRTRR